MGSSKPYTIITNGIINKHIYNQDELDYYLSNGWILGKHRSAEQLDSWKRKFHNTYQNKSDEEKEKLKLKNSISNKKRWDNTSLERRKEISQSISTGVSKMWSNLSDEDKNNRENHRQDTRNKWSEEEYKTYCNKMSESAKLARSKISKEQLSEIAQKVFNTRKINGTLNASKPEEELYKQLCDQYGVDDVKRNYNEDPRYPWHCDFYVVSEDLFIELNKFPTHYIEPFDENNEEHIALLEHCKTNPKNWVEEEMVNVWAGTDVLKQKAATQNNLNYKMIY